MPSPEAAAATRPARPVEPARTKRTTRAMASEITVQVPHLAGRSGDRARLLKAIELALGEFAAVEQACSRFQPDSALSRVNSGPGRWHRVPEPLYSTIRQARDAHFRTAGRFDPRIHDRLVQLGYDRSFHLLQDPTGPSVPGAGYATPLDLPTWRPRMVPGARLVNLGGQRVDLGGIGKGVALARAAARLQRPAADFIIDAGGDIYAAGTPSSSPGWRIGVEAPDGAPDPVAVLEISNLAVATSSIRVRTWKVDGRPVHHLIDPRTGQPGGEGLVAVTVVDADPVRAETAAKALFLAGRQAIAAEAAADERAALWVETGGTVGISRTMQPHVIWTGR